MGMWLALTPLPLCEDLPAMTSIVVVFLLKQGMKPCDVMILSAKSGSYLVSSMINNSKKKLDLLLNYM